MIILFALFYLLMAVFHLIVFIKLDDASYSVYGHEKPTSVILMAFADFFLWPLMVFVRGLCYLSER